MLCQDNQYTYHGTFAENVEEGEVVMVTAKALEDLIKAERSMLLQTGVTMPEIMFPGFTDKLTYQTLNGEQSLYLDRTTYGVNQQEECFIRYTTIDKMSREEQP